MTFLNPSLFWAGVAAIAIPILIHLLLRRRRRPVEWAAMRFLLAALRRHRRRLRMERWLLLAVRCLLLALIAGALGRPVLTAAGAIGARGPVTVYLLVDTGLAASVERGGGSPGAASARTALDAHKQAARSVLDGLDPARGDRAGLIVLGAPAESIVVPASPALPALAELLDALEPTDGATDLAAGMDLLRRALGSADAPAAGDAGETAVVVLSEFLLGSADTRRRLAPLEGIPGFRLLAARPSPEGADNATILGVDPLRLVSLAGDAPADASNQVRVRLRRAGAWVSAAGVSRIALGYESPAGAVPAGEGVARWAPGQSEAAVSVALTAAPPAESPAILVARLDDDAVPGDNTFRRALDVRETLRVALVGPRPSAAARIDRFSTLEWVRLALAPDADDARGASAASFEIVHVEPAALDQSRLAPLDAVVLAAPDALDAATWDRLAAFCAGGGLLVVFPTAADAAALWFDPLTRRLGLDWSGAREPMPLPAPESPVLDPGADAASGLLSVIAGELPDLARAVGVWKVLPVEAPEADTERVLSLPGGQPLILAAVPRGPVDAGPEGDAAPLARRGLVVLVTAALDFAWTDLPAKPLVVPLFQEILRQGAGRARGGWSVTAGHVPVAPARTIELRPGLAGAGPTGSVSVDPADGRAQRALRTAGVWRAIDERGGTRAVVTVNADPDAGRTEPQSDAEVGAWLAGVLPPGSAPVEWVDAASGSAATARAADQNPLARRDDSGAWSLWLLAGALAAAVAELILARAFSHALPGAPVAPVAAARTGVAA